jgi:LacI family transcriptional regulator/LacI family repressor for deo operon, udp, cdd, tsx, nupC, and nupG
MDSADGTRQAVEHLAALGHRRIAYLSGPEHSWSNGARLRGLRASAAATGVTALELGPFSPQFEAGLQAADLALASGVTAVLAYNDLMALGVLHRLAARGVRVPDHLSVVGFDDIAMAAMATPPLTTVVMPKEAAGRAAVELLLDQLALPAEERDNTEQRLLPAQLLVRASTMPPPRPSPNQSAS